MKKDFKFFIGEIDIDFSIPASMRRSELDQYLHRPRQLISGGRVIVNSRRNNNRGEDLPNTQRIRR
jgi:hypothetical protein